ncbi:hypothetical protein [Streptomyces sp. NPDC127119]|uniref:hypothetical protein n=1 Tax=Streptomyces sp. NPDC127119 TaxID=3345370 RepID=UPI00363CDAF1
MEPPPSQAGPLVGEWLSPDADGSSVETPGPSPSRSAGPDFDVLPRLMDEPGCTAFADALTSPEDRAELSTQSDVGAVIKRNNGARCTALRLTWRGLDEPALGGVAPSDWPDACSLLSDEQLEGLGGDHVRLPVGGSRTVFGVGLPHATRCRFVPESGSDKDIFVVTLRWVSADADTARALSASDLPWDTGVRRLSTGGHLVAAPG